MEQNIGKIVLRTAKTRELDYEWRKVYLYNTFPNGINQGPNTNDFSEGEKRELRKTSKTIIILFYFYKNTLYTNQANCLPKENENKNPILVNISL